MHRREAEWLGDRMARLSDDELFPLLNVGSSTGDFRSNVQPYINSAIFAPLAARGGKVWHADMKQAAGVDLVGDILDPAFQRQLSRLNPRSVLVSNFLEHVADLPGTSHFLWSLVAPNGYLFVSGPHHYPYHPDPIDNLFRPTIEEAVRLFPSATLVDSAIIDSGNWRQWDVHERGGRSLPRVLVRLMLPFYRPGKWLELARQSPYIVKHITAFAVVLRKSEDSTIPTA